MRIIVKVIGLGIPVALVGCGGSQPQPSMGMGSDPLAASGSLGTGPTKGNPSKKQPDLGVDTNLNGFKVFEDGSIWNKDVEKTAVDPNSSKILAKIGNDKTLSAAFGAVGTDKLPYGTPYVVVSSDAPRVAVAFTNTKGSDAGPYPFPLQMPIEAGAQAHAIVIDRDAQKLYETSGTKASGASYAADSGAVWDLRAYTAKKLPAVTADPSGLPVFPGLVRFDEVADPKGINHVLRLTVLKVNKSFVPPAIRSSGTTDDDLPPMGTHLRLKKTFNITKFPQSTQVILTALKKYGAIISDTGSADMGLSGTPDAHWMDDDLATLKQIKATDFEVLKPPPAPKLTKKEEAAAAAAAAAATPAAPAAPAATPVKTG